MASEEKVSAYGCPDGLDPKRWCDVELRQPDMWGDLRCARCAWQGYNIPQEQRYGVGAYQLPHFGERSAGDGE